MEKLLPNRPLFFICLLFLLSNVLMLVNNGMYWDDWTLTNMPFEMLKAQFIDNGGYYLGSAHIHWFLNSSFANPPLVYKWIVFLSGLFTAVFLYKSLSALNLDKTNQLAFYVAAIWACIPFNLAKVSMICFSYSITLCFFSIALFLFIRSMQKPNILARSISLLLFLCSFATNSLLVLYLIIIPVYFYLNNEFSVARFRKMILSIPDYLALPFIFAVFKMLFLKPSTSGLHGEIGYYEITGSKLFEIPTSFIFTFLDSSIGWITVFFSTVSQSLILLAAFIGLAFLLFKQFKQVTVPTVKIHMLYTGIALFVLGVSAYLLIGKVPRYNNFDSRHQLLIGFGVAFMLYWAITNFIQSSYFPVMFSMLISGLIIVNTGGHISLLRDWMKQESIKTNFETVTLDSLHSPIILVKDHTIPYNYDQISYEFYVWNGMYKATGKSTSKSFIAVERLREHNVPYCEQAFHYFNKKHLVDIEYLNLKDFHPVMECSTMKVDKGAKKLVSIPEVFKLVGLYYTNKESFHNRIGGYTALSFSATAPEL